MRGHGLSARILLRGAVYVLSMAIGVVALLYPFLVLSSPNPAMGQAHGRDAPLLLTVLVGLCFTVLLLEVQDQTVDAKFVALLGILVSINAVLRFAEVAIPGPGGFSPIFPLIILTGHVFGGSFGFLMGALTMLVSALVTGGIGPWLPYQVFTAGWIGMSVPICRPLISLGSAVLNSRYLPVRHRTSQTQYIEVLILAAFSGLWGLLYGVIINLWFWPFAAGPADQHWTLGAGVVETLRRYAAFYLATSLAWDAMRAVGNILLLLAFGAPALRALRRFQRRFAFDYRPAHTSDTLSGTS
jgi:energy-coupling factor transport system substrate-specific component